MNTKAACLGFGLLLISAPLAAQRGGGGHGSSGHSGASSGHGTSGGHSGGSTSGSRAGGGYHGSSSPGGRTGGGYPGSSSSVGRGTVYSGTPRGSVYVHPSSPMRVSKGAADPGSSTDLRGWTTHGSSPIVVHRQATSEGLGPSVTSPARVLNAVVRRNGARPVNSVSPPQRIRPQWLSVVPSRTLLIGAGFGSPPFFFCDHRHFGHRFFFGGFGFSPFCFGFPCGFTSPCFFDPFAGPVCFAPFSPFFGRSAFFVGPSLGAFGWPWQNRQQPAELPPVDAGSQDVWSFAPVEPGDFETPKEPAEGVVTVLVFTDGSQYGVTDYWLEAGKLHYVPIYGGANAAEVGKIDLQKTVDFNSARGVEFVLRPKEEPH